jgi:hypothetical protein
MTQEKLPSLVVTREGRRVSGGVRVRHCSDAKNSRNTKSILSCRHSRVRGQPFQLKPFTVQSSPLPSGKLPVATTASVGNDAPLSRLFENPLLEVNRGFQLGGVQASRVPLQG